MSDDLARQPALRRWQESVYGKGPYQVPDYESMAAIVQEHEQMASRIEELEAKLAMAVEILKALRVMPIALAELKGEDRG